MRQVRRFLLVVLGMCACSLVFSGEPTTNNPLLAEPRPWCIGRFVFDRPAASEISDQRYEYRGEKLSTQYNISLETYQATTEARESELRAKRRVDPGNRNKETGHSWLEKAFSPVKDSRVFVYQDAATDGVTLPFETEGYIYDNGTLVHTTGGIGSSAIGRVEDIYNDTYRRIKARDNWSVPTESGFCFDGGIVTGSSTYTEEVSQSFALMPGRPALLVIQMRDAVDADEKTPLTKTLPRLRAQMDRLPAHYRILRQGKRTIARMDAEEVLFELKEGALTSYRFYLLAPGDKSTLAKPHTAIQLLLGASSPDLTPEHATSLVDETGALLTWDTLLNSLRLRPGAVSRQLPNAAE
nr:T6SS immunity protein Tli4 family protein [Paraburkholderia bryophila]